MKIEYTPNLNDNKSSGAQDINSATRADLETIISATDWKADQAVYLQVFRDDVNFILLVWEDGVAGVTYGDGQNEYWTIHANSQGRTSSVDLPTALDMLREYFDGKEGWKDNAKWWHLQAQSKPGSGCLGLIVSAVVLLIVLLSLAQFAI